GSIRASDPRPDIVLALNGKSNFNFKNQILHPPHTTIRSFAPLFSLKPIFKSNFRKQNQPKFVTRDMDGHDADGSKQSTSDMTAFVQNLLQQMQTRFQTMSESVIGKIDEMGNRIDELEQSINDLRAEMGQDGTPSPSPSKTTGEPKSTGDSA
ncbi:hypothetical protein Leryth_025265, partial [Lithospermum erythrorhizon]